MGFGTQPNLFNHQGPDGLGALCEICACDVPLPAHVGRAHCSQLYQRIRTLAVERGDARGPTRRELP